SAPSSKTITVDYTTANGTALDGPDYVGITAANPGRLTFAPGETSKVATVAVVGNTLDEPNKNFFVNLSGPTNATITDGQATGNIIDDDAPPSLSINDVSVVERNTGTITAVFTVTLSGNSGQTVTV